LGRALRAGAGVGEHAHRAMEEFTLRGRKERTHVVIPVTPYPQRTAETATPAEQDALPALGKDNAQYLYSYEYVRDGKRLIAVANAWTTRTSSSRSKRRGARRLRAGC